MQCAWTSVKSKDEIVYLGTYIGGPKWLECWPGLGWDSWTSAWVYWASYTLGRCRPWLGDILSVLTVINTVLLRTNQLDNLRCPRSQSLIVKAYYNSVFYDGAGIHFDRVRQAA